MRVFSVLIFSLSVVGFLFSFELPTETLLVGDVMQCVPVKNWQSCRSKSPETRFQDSIDPMIREEICTQQKIENCNQHFSQQQKLTLDIQSATCILIKDSEDPSLSWAAKSCLHGILWSRMLVMHERSARLLAKCVHGWEVQKPTRCIQNSVSFQNKVSKPVVK